MKNKIKKDIEKLTQKNCEDIKKNYEKVQKIIEESKKKKEKECLFPSFDSLNKIGGITYLVQKYEPKNFSDFMDKYLSDSKDIENHYGIDFHKFYPKTNSGSKTNGRSLDQLIFIACDIYRFYGNNYKLSVYECIDYLIYKIYNLYKTGNAHIFGINNMLESYGYDMYYSILADIDGIDSIAVKTTKNEDGTKTTKTLLIQIKSNKNRKFLNIEEIKKLESKYDGTYVLVLYDYEELMQNDKIVLYITTEKVPFIYPSEVNKATKKVTLEEVNPKLVKCTDNYENNYLVNKDTTPEPLHKTAVPEQKSINQNEQRKQLDIMKDSFKKYCKKCFSNDRGREFYFDSKPYFMTGFIYDDMDNRNNNTKYQPIIPILSNGNNGDSVSYTKYEGISCIHNNKVVIYKTKDIENYIYSLVPNYKHIINEVIGLVYTTKEEKRNENKQKLVVFNKKLLQCVDEINKTLPKGIRIQVNDYAKGGGKNYISFAIDNNILDNIESFKTFPIE